LSASRDGWFISGNHIICDNGVARKHDGIICSNNNWNSRFRNLADSGDQRNIHQFFIRPDLFIEIRNDESATFRPELQMDPPLNCLRQHLKVRVVNRGRGVATDCLAKFRITGWVGDTKHPSTESKILIWDDGSPTKTIYPRSEQEILNVIFADSDSEQLLDRENKNIYAMVATNEAYIERQKRAQDGFGSGEFVAELYVKSKEGASCMVNLYLHISANHRNVTMRLSRWDQIVMIYKLRPSIIRFISSELRYRLG
jgi:hypothetical protein